MDRAYTLKEIDALRRIVEDHYLWGWYHGIVVAKYQDEDCQSKKIEDPRGSRSNSRSYNEKDMVSIVEERVRTFMIAGLTAEQILEDEEAAYEKACFAKGIFDEEYRRSFYKVRPSTEHKPLEFAATWTGR